MRLDRWLALCPTGKAGLVAKPREDFGDDIF
jgi:hypothetical protein